MVCETPSWFTHVTTVPVFTVNEEGSNAKFLIVMVFPPTVDAVGVAVVDGVWLEEQPATIQERIKITIHAEKQIKRECVGILP
jgi:hypothetical protein